MLSTTPDPKLPSDLVYMLALDAATGTRYAACLSGLYVMPDGGQVWRNSYESLNLDKPLSSVAVALSPNFVSDQTLFVGVNGAILRSTNAGASWYIAGLGTPPPTITTIAISPDYQHDGSVFASTLDDGIFYSSDRGQYWRSANFGLLDLHVMCIALAPSFAQNKTLFVGTESGVFYSENGGLAWRETTFPMDYAPVISLCLLGDHIILAGTETHGLFRSTGKGDSWTRLGKQELADPVNAILWVAEGQIWVLNGGMLMYSLDYGSTWNMPAVELENPITALTLISRLESQTELLVGLASGEIESIRVDLEESSL